MKTKRPLHFRPTWYAVRDGSLNGAPAIFSGSEAVHVTQTTGSLKKKGGTYSKPDYLSMLWPTYKSGSKTTMVVDTSHAMVDIRQFLG